jgi:hypothetical protein
MAAAEIKKPCCLVHNNTADEPRFEKKQKTKSTMLQGHQTL